MISLGQFGHVGLGCSAEPSGGDLLTLSRNAALHQGTLKNSLFGLAGLFAPWRHRKKRRNMSPYAPFFALCQKAKILRDIRI
jgi:hypothetical protein